MEWISVKDKLPQENYEVLTIDQYGTFYIGCIYDNCGELIWRNSYCCEDRLERHDTKIIFWMELPEYPEITKMNKIGLVNYGTKKYN